MTVTRENLKNKKTKVKFKILEKRKEFFDAKFVDTINAPKFFWSNINTLIYNENSKIIDMII